MSVRFVGNPCPTTVRRRVLRGVCPRCGLKSASYEMGEEIDVHCSSTCGRLHYDKHTHEETRARFNPFRDERVI